MKHVSRLVLLLAVLLPGALGASEVDAVLDDWHDAAAHADEARYFGHFARGGVFMGTDITERWTAADFRAWSRPYFARGKAWSFKAHDRKVSFSRDGSVAWFDELLETPNMGPCRGSGVLVKEDGAWRIAQYNLGIPIPNELAKEVVRMIAESAKASTPTPAPTRQP